MEYAATLQQIGNTELVLDFDIPTVEISSADAQMDRTVENLVLAAVAAIPSFQIGSMISESIVARIGQLLCVQEASSLLLHFYALIAIPLMFYAARNKGTFANLAWSASFASILGCLAYLSLS